MKTKKKKPQALQESRQTLASGSWFPWIVAFISFLIFAPFSWRGIDAHHDGLMLKGAVDVLNGQILFKDSFAQYGAMTTYVQAFFLRIFGANLFSLKLATTAVYAFSGALLAASWSFFLPRRLAIFGIGMWILFAPFYRMGWATLPWSSSYTLFFQSLAVLLLLHSLKSEKPNLLAFFTGICAGFAIWCRVPVGALLFISLAISYMLVPFYSVKHKGDFKPLGACTGGFLLICAGFLLQLKINGSYNDWVNQVFGIPQLWMTALGGTTLGRVCNSLFVSVPLGLSLLGLICAATLPFRPNSKEWLPQKFAWIYWVLWMCALGLILVLFPEVMLITKHPESVAVVGGWATMIPLFLVGSFLITGLTVIRQPEAADDRLVSILLVSIVAVASWSQYYPVPCFRHVFWSISPAIGPFLFFLNRAFRGKTGLMIGLVSLLLVPLALEELDLAQKKLSYSYIELSKPAFLKGMLVEREQGATLQAITDAFENYFHTHRAKPIVVEGPDALYSLYTTDLRNPGPLFIFWGIFRDPEIMNQRNLFVQQNHPLVFLQDRPEDGPYGAKRFKDFGYTTLLKVDNFEILAPQESQNQ